MSALGKVRMIWKKCMQTQNLFVIIIVRSNNLSWWAPYFASLGIDMMYKIAFISNHVNAKRNMKRHGPWPPHKV